LAQAAEHQALQHITTDIMKEPPSTQSVIDRTFGPQPRPHRAHWQAPAPIQLYAPSFTTVAEFEQAATRFKPFANEVEIWSARIGEVLAFERLGPDAKTRHLTLEMFRRVAAQRADIAELEQQVTELRKKSPPLKGKRK
jgi:hypothetical protein